ncbi:MAG: LysM peptidoglycan-binding domain-containing protein [Chloroflexi bacterium]|nr:LysM peptidoglycan-binding domain-containing protein [Chloroflexota bacterium]
MKKTIVLVTILSLMLLSISNVSADTPVPPGQVYVVEPGDWLSKLATEFYDDAQSWPAIVNATNAKAATDNNFATIANPDLVRAGQRLWIPTDAAYTSTAAPVSTNGTSTAASMSMTSGEQNTVRYFNTVRESSPLLTSFLTQMPKGGDLHIHLSGSIYAENYIEWAAEDGLCIDETTMVVSAESCAEDGRPASEALTDSVFHREIVDAWSMRNWELSGQSGHDHFFDTFGEYGDAKDARIPDMFAQVMTRAATEHVSYLEIMVTLTTYRPREIVAQVGWSDDWPAVRDAMLANGLPEATETSQQTIDTVEAEYLQMLGCDTNQPEPACDVTVRYIHQVKRYREPQDMFADMLAAFELASADPSVVSLNLVAAEDGRVAMRDYSLHMEMLGYFRQEYPDVQVTLHAGELTLGLVPSEELRYHIREAVEVAQVARIGHGVDIMYEDGAFDLLDEMAERDVLVEICLSSNDLILGVAGKDHPLSIYIEHDVPVALSTDDLGIARSNWIHEYQKAVKEQNLDYIQLKTMTRASLEYAFVEGDSLWRDFDSLAPVSDCTGITWNITQPSTSCQQFLDENLKAQLQWELEAALWEFENTCCD